MGGVAAGMVEHGMPLLGGSFGLQLADRWSLALGGAYVFPDTKNNGDRQTVLRLGYGYLLGCARALGTRDSARADWCAAPLLGSLRGQGQGYSEANPSRGVLWFAIASGPQFVFPPRRSCTKSAKHSALSCCRAAARLKSRGAAPTPS